MNANNPLLRDIPNLSPVTATDIVIGYGEDGFADWRIVRIGDLVTDDSGSRIYRVIGFDRDNQVILTPHGLNHDPAVMTITATGFGMTILNPEPETVLRHSDGFVEFEE